MRARSGSPEKTERNTDPKEVSRRKRNETTDELAVAGAKQHAAPPSLFL